ncbi:MAG: arsenite methyltransferase [Planctomycetota bacterium]|jgi:SAM-dependent methyltransferase
MSARNEDDVRDAVRESYAKVAGAGGACCSPDASCCASGPSPADKAAALLGYSEEDAASVPAGSNLGLGCGNPGAIAALAAGERVLDLGSGGGFDCFLAARKVGRNGRVIGVDMTPEMVRRARDAARSGGHANVEFRLGEIEHLPVADASVDVVISNCVVNLSPEKPAVIAEMFRVLRPGGRVAITDVLATAPLPEAVQNDMEMLCECISGAAGVEEVRAMLEGAGFVDTRITPHERSREIIAGWLPARGLEDCITSAAIEARKPG